MTIISSLNAPKFLVKKFAWNHIFQSKNWYYIFKHNEVASQRRCLKKLTQKMKFSIKDFFSNCDLQKFFSFLRIWPHLLKKSSMENSIFCAVITAIMAVIMALVFFSTHWRRLVFRCFQGVEKETGGMKCVNKFLEFSRL